MIAPANVENKMIVMRPHTLVSTSLLALAFTAGSGHAADATLERAATAMGANGLKSLQYSGKGIGYTFGQAYKPGLPWPRIRIQSFQRVVNYETGSMRDEIAFSRAEALGGGGYPHTGQQRNVQFVSGAHAWNQLAIAPLPGPRFVMDRIHQLWMTPQGAIKAALRNNAKVKTERLGGRTVAVATFTEPGRFMANVYLDDNHRVERIESRLPDPVLGEVAVVTRFSGYRDFAGLPFPTRIRQSQGGFPTLDLEVTEVVPNAPADIAVPELVRNASERVTSEKVAEGVWFVAGGSHNSVAIEMKDHLIVVEAPLNEGRTAPMLEHVKQLAPGKPIRYLVNSHHHFDHSGGLRTAVAEGATIVMQAQSKPYFEKAFAAPSTIAPDRLAKSGKRASIRMVEDKLVLTDGTRAIEILRIADSHHADTFLMVYLPAERLLIQADGFTPPPPNTPPPARPNPGHVNLIENIERLQLRTERILPLHGRVVPVADLYTAAGMKPGN